MHQDLKIVPAALPIHQTGADVVAIGRLPLAGFSCNILVSGNHPIAWWLLEAS